MNIETKNARLPFPSQVTTPCENEIVRALSRDIVDSSRDTNNLLAAGGIHNLVREHYIDTANGIYGIESLIKSILKANGSVFPKGSEETELKAIAIAGGMFTSEIIAKVRETFGADRYPDCTIRMYLTEFAKGIGKIQLTGAEDMPRPCPKPRCKWYLIAE